MKFIVTFGSGHLPGIAYYTTVEAKNEGEAREKIVEAIGIKWAFMYMSEKDAGVRKHNLTYMPLEQVANLVYVAYNYYQKEN